MDVPQYLRLYDERYFKGNNAISGYDDYENCRGVLRRWGELLQVYVRPTAVLDVGCAYAFLVEYFQDYNIPATGVEPSPWALDHKVEGCTVFAGSLPDLSPELLPRYDTVCCTEVLEHVPEALVGASLTALADRTDRMLVCLIMLEGPGADGDEGHITLKSRQWWQDQFALNTSLIARPDIEAEFDRDAYALSMWWSGRFFVYQRHES